MVKKIAGKIDDNSHAKENIENISPSLSMKESLKNGKSTPIRKKMLAEKKVKNILKLFEENDEPKNDENSGNVDEEVDVDFVVCDKPEDDLSAVRVKHEDEKTTEENSKLKKKKEADSQEVADPGGHDDDEHPGDRSTIGMPDAGPDWPPTLLGMSHDFKLKTKFKSGVLFKSCDSKGTLPNCINNYSAQDYTAVAGHWQPQPIGSQLTHGQGTLNRGAGLGLASREEMGGRPANESEEEGILRAEICTWKLGNKSRI